MRDSIGPDSSLTDDLPGAATFRAGDYIGIPLQLANTPGMVFTPQESGIIHEVKFVAFGSDGEPMIDVADFVGTELDFHFWTDGLDGGPNSFVSNPAAYYDWPGHQHLRLVDGVTNLVEVEAWGVTGPKDPNGEYIELFTTFLVTADLTSFGFEVEAGEEYVMSFTHPKFNNSHKSFRLSGSRATGFEDVFFSCGTTSSSPDCPIADSVFPPGYLNSQLEYGIEQYGGYVSIDAPVLGDMDGDDSVTLADVNPFIEALTNRAAYDAHNFATPAGALVDADWNGDVNGDGEFNLGDVADFKALLSPLPAGSNAVPEPSSVFLAFSGLCCLLYRAHGHFPAER